MAQTKSLVPFKYQDIELTESVMIEGKPHFTRKAIGEWLGYADPQNSVDKIIERNQHIREFSLPVKLSRHRNTIKDKSFERKMETLVYDPIGFQLIVMESRQPRAIQYKVAVAHLVQAYMTGKLVKKDAANQAEKKLELEIKKQRTDACDRNSKSRLVKLIMSMVDDERVSSESKKSLIDHATSILIPPTTLKPVIGKTYTATEIAAELGTTANMIGRISEKYGLKTEKYGHWVLDKSRYCEKQVSSFIYNEEGRRVIIEIYTAKMANEQKELFTDNAA